MPLHLPVPPRLEPLRLDDLARDRALLGLWMREHGRLWAGMDDKAAAAVLLSGLSSEMMAAILGRASGFGEVPWPQASDMGLELNWTTWTDGTASTPVLTYRVEIGGPTDVSSPRRAQAIADLHGPLVTALATATRLGARALWRIVTDSVSQACLEAGQRRGDAAAGMALARDILNDKASPLFNRQWSYFEVEAHRPDGRSVREWFRARGGCCRYYTTAGGATCSTCVLRDPASREAILRDWLATRAEAA